MMRLTLVIAAATAACTSDSNGQFRATWSVTQGGVATTCGAVGADKVSVLSTRNGTTTGNDDIFTCSDFEGTTDPYPNGGYIVSVSLLSGNTVLGTPLDFTITLDGGIRDLPPVVFAF